VIVVFLIQEKNNRKNNLTLCYLS